MQLALLAFGVQEWLLIVIALLLVFGATKIPQLMRGMGQGIKEFKEAVKDDDPALGAGTEQAPPPDKPE